MTRSILRPNKPRNAAPLVAMTVDVEGRPKNAAMGTRRLLDLFARLDVRGTFFVLGELAAAAPDLVREIAAAGHEIGFHGWRHEFLFTLRPTEFASQLREWIPRLENLAQAPVRGFRAPYFSLQRRCAWALLLLADAGLRYDASIYPGWNDRYGWPGAPCRPVRLAASDLIVFPVPLLGVALPVAFSGGAYLRMLPWIVVAWGLQRQLAQGRPGMIYAHPWEMLQPTSWTKRLRASNSWRERWRVSRQAITSQLGRSRLPNRLERLLALATPARVRPMGEVIEQLGDLPEWRVDTSTQNELVLKEELA